MLQGIADGYAGIDAEQVVERGLGSAGGEGDDAEGFVLGWVDHWAPPEWVALIAGLRRYDFSETLIGIAPIFRRELPHSFPGEWWQLCAGWKPGVIGKPGRLESLPRTAAIARICWHKNGASSRDKWWRLCAYNPRVSRPGRWIRATV